MSSRTSQASSLVIILTVLVTGIELHAQTAGVKLNLREGWAIQSSEKVAAKGETLSTGRFTAEGWYRTAVPSTVLAALVANDLYPDPYFAMNLRKIPGATYPIGQNFSNLPFPSDSPFRVPWWYRTAFQIPAELHGKTLWLHFGGINFRANIWLNGKRIAASDRVAGPYRVYEFNITGTAKAGETNVLAVEVFPPQPNDLGITWVDWNPAPPDKNMGLWREVYITSSGPVAVRWPHVVTRLGMPLLDTAQLIASAELRNAKKERIRGTLQGRIGSVEFTQPVELGAGEEKTVTFTPEKFPQLTVKNPRLWWPVKLGPQNLYDLEMEFESGGVVSDRATITFGIREITTEKNDGGHLIFKINGQRILIRGAGWAPDMMLRSSPARQEAEIRYVENMNLNTIRLEGKMEDNHFLELCDRRGILILAGWCCCDHWEKWNEWKPEDYVISVEMQRDQIRRLRSHPSVFSWMNASDGPPPAKVEEAYIKVLKELHWPNPYQSSAKETPSELTGPSGVKMKGPYEYVGPSYWLTDDKNGGAYGFNTETGPGPGVPPIESLRKFIPADHLWPIDEYWDFHAGGGEFKDLKVFTEAMNASYGAAKSAEDYAWKSQLMTYDGHRAMFEAFGRNKYSSTGVIQWMLNSAWPSLIWQLYDYYLRPGGGYFGAQKACEPLHIQYSYDDRSVVVVNSYYEEQKGLKARAAVYNLDLTEKFQKDVVVDAGPDSSTRIFSIPEIPGLTTTYFVKLDLQEAAGKTVSSNFYWLSTRPEVHDWAKTEWYYTPLKSYADFTALQSLAEVALHVAGRVEHKNHEDVQRITVTNPGPGLAIAVRLRITKGKGGEELLPVFWDDNYFALMPGEKREVTATYREDDLEGEHPVIVVDGWNVKSSAPR
jgi:exo-1,4-beta-D-glucosaminidase